MAVEKFASFIKFEKEILEEISMAVRHFGGNAFLVILNDLSLANGRNIRASSVSHKRIRENNLLLLFFNQLVAFLYNLKFSLINMKNKYIACS